MKKLKFSKVNFCLNFLCESTIALTFWRISGRANNDLGPEFHLKSPPPLHAYENLPENQHYNVR